MLQSDACRIKEKKNITNEKPGATWSQGFFCCLTPPQITSFFSLLLKTKVQYREIKNATWSFYFQVCGSSSFSCLAVCVLIPVTSCPCWPWGWLTGLCLHSLHVGEQVKPCPRQTGCRQFPLTTLPVKYLQISPFMVGPPRAENSPAGDSNFPPPLFQLLFLSFLGSSHYFSLFTPLPGPLFPWTS